ncbi:hypothetical protein WJX82_004297 [Trebouxia sp. C0006]
MSGAGRRLLSSLSSGFAKAAQSGSSQTHRAVGVAGGSVILPAMCSVENNPAKRAKIDATPVVDVRPSNGFRSYSTIVYPAAEAFVSAPAPDFTAPAVIDGEISEVSLKNYKGQYVILFFYPKDFTFVCPTEIIAFSERAKQFEQLNCQLIAASCDTEETHLAWIKTPRKKGGLGIMQIPIMADTTKEIAARYGVLVKDKGIALRGLFIINPQGVLEQSTINNLPIGRSVDEALRLLQAIQFTAEHGEVCPANWKPGSKSMIPDAEKSLEYFRSAGEVDSTMEDATKLTIINNKKEYTQLLKSNKPVVIDFMASWCGKCSMIAPYIEELQEKNPDVIFAKFDTSEDALEKVAEELKIQTLPSFKFFKGGKEVVDQVVGYKKKPIADAVEQLRSA